MPTSRLVSNITGMQVQRNKAIVGRNAFAHEAGIHQDGMLKERTTYEIMHPEDVGLTKTDLVLGKHSGRAALADRAKALGYHLSAEQLQTVFEQFKDLADKKKEVYDADIAALIEQEMRDAPETWTIAGYRLVAERGQVPTVTLTLRRGGEEFSEEIAAGDGPFDAMFRAVERITGVEVVCKDFNVHSVTVGKDAQAEVTVEVEHGGKIYRGRGVSTDSVEASVQAFLNAVNHVVAHLERTGDASRRRQGGRKRLAAAVRQTANPAAGPAVRRHARPLAFFRRVGEDNGHVDPPPDHRQHASPRSHERCRGAGRGRGYGRADRRAVGRRLGPRQLARPGREPAAERRRGVGAAAGSFARSWRRRCNRQGPANEADRISEPSRRFSSKGRSKILSRIAALRMRA